MDILGWKSVVNEVFFDWEPDNYQFAFYMKDGSCDKIDAYGELWSLKDMGNDTTTVRVQAAFQMNGTVLNWIVKHLPIDTGFEKELKAIQTYVQ